MKYRQELAAVFGFSLALWGACSSDAQPSQGSGGFAGEDGNDDTGGTGGSPTAGGGGSGGAISAAADAGAGGSGGRAGAGGQGGRGGTGGSAGAGGVGGAGGARPAARPAVSTCTDHPYCNNFETLAVGARPPGSISLTTGNTIAVVDTKAFSGMKSLQIEASRGSAWVRLLARDNLPDPKRATYMRMMLWMENLPGGDGHWSVLGLSGTADGGAIGTYNGFVSFGGNSNDARSRLLYGGAGADCDKSATPPIPTGKWVCVEMKVDDTAAVQYGVNMDGVAIKGLSFTRNKVGSGCFMPGKPMGVWYVPGLNNLEFGFNYWHNQGRPVRLWIDELVVDQVPIGCP
jgi:hypothetical protein